MQEVADERARHAEEVQNIIALAQEALQRHEAERSQETERLNLQLAAAVQKFTGFNSFTLRLLLGSKIEKLF